VQFCFLWEWETHCALTVSVRPVKCKERRQDEGVLHDPHYDVDSVNLIHVSVWAVEWEICWVRWWRQWWLIVDCAVSLSLYVWCVAGIDQDTKSLMCGVGSHKSVMSASFHQNPTSNFWDAKAILKAQNVIQIWSRCVIVSQQSLKVEPSTFQLLLLCHYRNPSGNIGEISW